MYVLNKQTLLAIRKATAAVFQDSPFNCAAFKSFYILVLIYVSAR